MGKPRLARCQADVRGCEQVSGPGQHQYQNDFAPLNKAKTPSASIMDDMEDKEMWGSLKSSEYGEDMAATSRTIDGHKQANWYWNYILENGYSNIKINYTACSRAQNSLYLLGNIDSFNKKNKRD